MQLKLITEVLAIFGNTSLFDAQVDDVSSFPLELPMERYIKEGLFGMRGAPKNSSGIQYQGSPSWQRYQRALGSDTAKDLVTTLFWLCVGTLFETVPEALLDALRMRLAQLWSVFIQEQVEVSRKERDQLLDGLPVIFVQTVYRLIVDAFPPEQAVVIQYETQMLEKLGIIVTQEISGFRPSLERLLEGRRKLFLQCIIDHAFMNVLEARRAELRQQQLEGAKPMPPLRWGGPGAEGRDPMDEQQVQDVMEQRNALLADEVAQGRSPLVPPELAVEHYESYVLNGEAVFSRQEAEFTELHEEYGSDEMLDENGGPMSPSRALSILGTRGARPSRFGAVATAAALKAERARRDGLMLRLLTALLPERFEHRPLALEATSPLMERMAPGARVPCCGFLRTEMKPTKAFLSKIESGKKIADCDRSGSESPTIRKTRSSPKLPSIFKPPVADPCVLPPKKEVLQELPLRVPHQEVMRRVEADLQGRKDMSFEEYKKEYDIISGFKRRHPSDNNKMMKEEQAYLSKIETLIGSRSTPALRRPLCTLR